MQTSRKGNAGELRVLRELEDAGWVVASRRHVGGAGDLFAAKAGVPSRVIEVKSRLRVWEGFRRQDRIDLIALAAKAGCEPWLAWVKPRCGVVWLAPESWPS